MSTSHGYRLLDAFERLFRGARYRHRASTQGDLAAVHLYEDLHNLRKSARLLERIDSKGWVVNIQNTRRGIAARRGDGTFGEKVPGTPVVEETGFVVSRGPLATVEIGIEVKILAKAMIKQIDRVGSDLRGQVDHFRRGGDQPISVGIVGINNAEQYTSYEGDRQYSTDGKKEKHPAQEASAARIRLQHDAVPSFDFFLFLQFKATNVEPYPFEWVDPRETAADYAAVLTRISREYDRRFPGQDESGRCGRAKTTLTVNETLQLGGIPPEVFAYRLGNRSALEWVIDQYRVSEDPRSGITSDPNRPDDKEYIVRLVGQVVRVSVETVGLVNGLPTV
jgi:hypothetical protein